MIPKFSRLGVLAFMFWGCEKDVPCARTATCRAPQDAAVFGLQDQTDADDASIDVANAGASRTLDANANALGPERTLPANDGQRDSGAEPDLDSTLGRDASHPSEDNSVGAVDASVGATAGDASTVETDGVGDGSAACEAARWNDGFFGEACFQ